MNTKKSCLKCRKFVNDDCDTFDEFNILADKHKKDMKPNFKTVIFIALAHSCDNYLNDSEGTESQFVEV